MCYHYFYPFGILCSMSEQVYHTFNLIEESEYLKKLSPDRKKDYLRTLTACDIDCPYFIPESLWKTDPTEYEKYLPQISEHDLQIYLVAQRSQTTEKPINAIRSIVVAIAIALATVMF